MADKVSANEEEPSNSEVGDFEGETGSTLPAKNNEKQPTKWAENVLTSIEASKTPELARFLLALGIRHIGERTAKTLAQVFDMLEYVCHALEPILACLPDIGTVAAHSIAHLFAQEAQQTMTDELLAVSVVPQSQVITIPPLRHAEPQHWVARLSGFKISEARALALWEFAGQGVEDLQAGKALLADWQTWRSKPQNTTLLEDMKIFFAQTLSNLQDETISDSTNRAVTGRTFVLTETSPTLKRNQAQAMIEVAGGKASDGVPEKADYVVAGEAAGSKLEKAQTLDIAVLSEEELLSLLG